MSLVKDAFEGDMNTSRHKLSVSDRDRPTIQYEVVRSIPLAVAMLIGRG